MMECNRMYFVRCLTGGTEIVTVIQSGLCQSYQVREKKTVRFRYLAKEQLRQNVTIIWPPGFNNEKGIDLKVASVLNTVTTFSFSDAIANQIETILDGEAAGILHVFPQEPNSELAPTIQASEIRCIQRINPQPECLIDSDRGVEISFGASDEYFEFAFRTDHTAQSLFEVYMTENLVSHYRLENDFFMRIDGYPRNYVGMLADGRWHTVKFRISTRPQNLDLVSSLGINRFALVKFFPQFSDPLPSPACGHRENEEQQAYHLLRVPDLLSFLYLPDVLSPLSIKTAMTFRSDADSGLLMFGSWKEEEEWGRFQVHYHGEKMTAMYCTQSETFDEKCSACAVYRIGGFSSDNWSRVAFYKDLDSYYLMVDRELCELKLLTEENEFDTSEMYKTLLIRGSVLFIGGMFHKRNIFENTREKLPSLRGCVKDVFSNGHRVNLHEEFERQMTKTLVAPQKRSFGVMRGCGVCAVRCKGDARCRPMTSSRDPEFACDCADNYQYSNFGTCRKPRDGSLSLSATSLNAYRSIYTVPRNSGVLQRIWLKLRLPSVELKENTPLVMFYSYGRIIFRVFLDVYGSLNVQMNPEDPGVFTASAGKQIPKGDDRIHLVKLERRTPLGTHPSRRFFNLYIDGSKFSVQDPGLPLTSVEFALINVLNDKEAGCVTDFGAAYEYDEHNGGMVQQIDLKGLMMQDLGLSDGNDTCGAVDPRLWIYGPPESEPSVFGKIHDYTPNGRPEAALLLSPQWMIYSVLLTCFLVLLILLCLCLYCFLLKKGGKKIDDDDLYPDSKMSRHLIRRRSDEYPVIMRRPTLESNRDSYISDSLDNSDIRAYDDIRTHKVKIDRESMISFLDPVNEESRLAQARIVRRNVDENAPLVHIHDFEH
ncbi:unnamed protein product, partial [Mesorhabditis belari]|uniref:Laminin G domain-containing protein n=1 Tax=Mesorhabditis belari TaxID=2138241 RepID=A0AAF3FMV9_9BILA